MRLRIGSKILAGYFIMVSLLLIGGLVTILYTYRLQNVTSRMLAENVSSLKAAQELEVALFRMRGLTLSYIVDGDPHWITTLEQRKSEFLSWLAEARVTAITEEESRILDRIASLFSTYQQDLQSALDLNRARDTHAATQLLLKASRGVFDTIYSECEAFVSHNENSMYVAEERISRTNSAIRLSMYGIGLGGVVMGVFLGLVFSRNIIKPIYELVLKVRGATGGEIVERLEVTKGSELEELDRQVRELIHRINTTTADLETNRKLLAHAEKLATLGRVAAGVAHEIRNPLTAIKMLIYSMKEELAIDLEHRKDMDVIIKEIDRMERFVKTFLQFARPPDPSYSPIELKECIHDTLILLDPRIRQVGAELVESHDENVGRVLADPDQIKQVMINLLLNAVAAMPNGGRLAIETRLKSEESIANGKTWVQIAVVDSGSGIPEEIRDILFEPFVSASEQGMGLGLSMAYQIINRHGGWIDAKNNPTGGATFTVHIPYNT
jgi:signal transduction histidine kinase